MLPKEIFERGSHFFVLSVSQETDSFSKYLPWKLKAFFGSDASENSLHQVETTQSARTFWRWALTAIEINNLLHRSYMHGAFNYI